MTPSLVPTLDQLATDPTKALGLPPDVRRRLALNAIAIAHALAPVFRAVPPPHQDNTRTPVRVTVRVRP